MLLATFRSLVLAAKAIALNLLSVGAAYDRGISTTDAIRHGLRTTAGTVTSAAIIMVAVFGVFATLSAIEFKQLGIGLAAAILIDATIVRAVLLPAAMTLLGETNWYLPRWLQWLPRVSPAAAPAAAAPLAAARVGRREPEPARP